MKNTWAKAIGNKYFTLELIVSSLTLISTMFIFSKFTAFVELRKGVQLNDPFLNTFQAIDLTQPIFMVIYGGLILAFIILLRSPFRLTMMIESYTLMVFTRLVMMYILPLAPPEGMIILKDPFVEFISTGKPLVNDLFFSGHTATVTLLLLGTPKKYKWIFLGITFFVAIGVLLQKVHYTVDVLVAPLVSFTCYYLVFNFFRYRHNMESDQDKFNQF